MSDQPAAPPRWGAWRLVVFLLLALAALDLVVASYAPLWRAYDPDPYRERLEACQSQPWDLVVVGGSPVMYGVDPTVLSGVRRNGRELNRVYDLGLPLATASEISLAVEHDLPTPAPRLLLYGASATDFNEDRVEPRGPGQLMDLRDAARWARGRPESTLWCARQFALQRVQGAWSLYAYRNGIRLWAADQAECLWPGACPEAAAAARGGLATSAYLRASHGFQSPTAGPATRLDCLKASGQVDTSAFAFMENYRLDEHGYLHYLRRMIDVAHRRGIAVVLFDVPPPADLDERLYRREFAAYRAALASVAKERGVPVLWPTRESVGLTDADFADMIHLNQDGAARLSAWLRNQLENMDAEARP